MDEDVIRTISKKLRHYLEVQRREEGFVLPVKKNTLQQVSKGKDMSKTKEVNLHQRSINHLLRSRQIHRILTHLDENYRLSEREKKVKSSLVQYVMGTDTQTTTVSRMPIKIDTSLWRDTSRYKTRKFVGSVTRAEAERLITTASRLYVTMEMLMGSKLDYSLWEKHESPLEQETVHQAEGCNTFYTTEQSMIQPSLSNVTNSPEKNEAEEKPKHDVSHRSPNKKKIIKVKPRRKEEIKLPEEEIKLTEENIKLREEENKLSEKNNTMKEEEILMAKQEIQIMETVFPIKILKDNWCQTDKWPDITEWKEKKDDSSVSLSRNSSNLKTSSERKETSIESGESSDLESGVHLLSYNSGLTKNYSDEEAVLFHIPEYSNNIRSISTDTTEDSNYCDDSYSSSCSTSATDSSQICNMCQAESRRASEIYIQASTSQPLRENFSETCSSTCSCTDKDNSVPDDECSTCNELDTCSCCSCQECQFPSESESCNRSSCNCDDEESECNTCSCTTVSENGSCEEIKKDEENEDSQCKPKEDKYPDQSNAEKTEEVVENTNDVQVEEQIPKDEDELPSKDISIEKEEEELDKFETEESDKSKNVPTYQTMQHQLTVESCDSYLLDEETRNLSIHYAAKNGDLDVVKLLSKANRKFIETVDERGWTPIHLAAANNHTEIVKFLALEGAHVSALDPSGYTALHTAAMQGHKDCIEELLEAEANVDSVTSDGFTPLHLSALNNHVECCKVLLAWGASLSKEDALGRTVLDMVEEYSLKDMKKFLENFQIQLENLNNIVDVMDSFSDKKSDPSDPAEVKPVHRNILSFLTSMADDDDDDNDASNTS